ncbi:MAG TPA: DNA polymerase domain-containing protein [Candidatus Nitrosocosmicus sp.]|nr:DNA polymerase domain-containing protein [Candidatus Nitrosocosmicus sp.]
MRPITNGWLFDICHIKDRMILWIKQKEGDVKRLEYPWLPSIYVASDLKKDLSALLDDNRILSLIKGYEFEVKFEYPSSISKNGKNKNEVLKLTLADSLCILNLARRIEKLSTRFGRYRLYNVDISPEQAFLYEKELYPLGLYNIGINLSNLEGSERYQIINDKNDGIDSFEYVIPELKFLSFELISEKKTIANDFRDEILKIKILVFNNDTIVKEKFSIHEENELETLLEFAYEINRIDPDIILTTGGDQFLFPHLLYRAKANKVENQLLANLNRETNIEYILKKNRLFPHSVAMNNSNSSISYISYGKVYFKPQPFFLYGRTHIDINNSFIYKDNGLDGLAELCRVCRIPMQIASRSTIGKCLSSLYFYNAQKSDVLIPWKPTTSEVFKSFSDLLKADKGGSIFESKPGVYDNVAEFDFVSLYPSIMLKKNVSSDTINCDCCKSESENQVPELKHLYHVCKRRTGIVPLSLKTVLDRRLEYKHRKNNNNNNNNQMKLRARYDNRQTALKWILVTSFGYLGFSNSKFGRIDAHIAVCAFARDLLLTTSKIAERHGFEIIHGIVDSIWIKERTTKPRTSGSKDTKKVTNSDIRLNKLKLDIEELTNFSISFEGVYKWIVFDYSKSNPTLPALNRYFGVFQDGTIKMRGIETRRHDTPPLFLNFQQELVNVMSSCRNINEIIFKKPQLEKIHDKYCNLLVSREVNYTDLIFTKRISKNGNEYANRKTVENCVLKKLADRGKHLHAGEQIKYIITDFYSKNFLDRAIPIELINKNYTKYDSKRYLEILNDTYDSITKVFYQKI